MDDEEWVEVLNVQDDLVNDWLMNDTSCSPDALHDQSPKKDGVDFGEVKREIIEHIVGIRSALSDPEHLRLRAVAAWEDRGGLDHWFEGPFLFQPRPDVQESPEESKEPVPYLEDASADENGNETLSDVEEGEQSDEEEGMMAVKEDESGSGEGGEDGGEDGDYSGEEGGSDTDISEGREIDEYDNTNGNYTENGENYNSQNNVTREMMGEEVGDISQDKLISEGEEEIEKVKEEEKEKGKSKEKKENDITELTVEEGSRLRLVCNVTGIKDVWVEWRRALNLTFPGGAAVVGGRSVFFDFVGREDAGTYICTARNNGSSTYSTALTIHVQYAPVVGVWARTVGQEGMELGCLGEGRPQPTLAWYKNNTKLSNACGGHTEVKSTALSPGFVLSVAKLTNTSEQDFALYHCRAANSLRVSRSFLMVHDGSGEMSVDYLDHEDPVVYSTPVENPRLASFLLGMVPPLYIALYIIAYLSCYKSPSTGGHGRFGANMDMDGE